MVEEAEFARWGKYAKLVKYYRVATWMTGITCVVMVTLSVVALGVALHVSGQNHGLIEQVTKLSKQNHSLIQAANHYSKSINTAAQQIAEKLTGICSHIVGCK